MKIYQEFNSYFTILIRARPFRMSDLVLTLNLKPASYLGAAAKELNLKVSKSWAPEEPHKERKTLLKAAYVNKKHRVQYEMR